MIDLSNYTLSAVERTSIESLLSETGFDLNLQQLYALLDKVWSDLGCDASKYEEDKYTAFYRHPIWLLNGIFIEQHEESLGNLWATQVGLRHEADKRSHRTLME
jgi:2-polyprenyl-6-hydroxyphenyl methylase/3-demethylubiquinone-9 3-methyltransferase